MRDVLAVLIGHRNSNLIFQITVFRRQSYSIYICISSVGFDLSLSGYSRNHRTVLFCHPVFT